MKKHILLVDDDHDELAIFTDALKAVKGEFRFSFAGGADQAMEALPLRPDFIFVDYNMPEINGLQLLSVIKNEPGLKKTKVFIYSAMITEEINKMAQILGAAGCIEKPQTINRLIHEFKAIFAGDLLPAFAYLKAK